MAGSDAAAGSSLAPGLQDVASVAETTSDYKTVDNSGLESSFVKTVSQNYNTEELRRILGDIYCSTVNSLNLEVIQVWLRVVQDIRAFLLAHEDEDYLQLCSKSMHLRLTTCWNEILYAIIGHVRHAPSLLGQDFQGSAGNKKLTIDSCMACFCEFCNEVGLTWNNGVNDILNLMRDLLTILKDNYQDASIVETWIRQAEESQVNITSACTEFQKSFKVLTSLVDEEQVPSEALLMQKLFTVCTGDMRQSLEMEMISQLQDDVLMSERCVSSAAVLEAKKIMLKVWNDTVRKLLANFTHTWAQDTRLSVTDVYITALESFHGSWARILCSVMVATDLLESDFIRIELEPATVKAVQAGILADLSRETDLMKAPLPDESGGSPSSEPFPLVDPTYWYKSWLSLAHAVEQCVLKLGDLLIRQDKATLNQVFLSRLYQGAANCLERYEQVCSLLRHFVLYEANTSTCIWQMSLACEELQHSVNEHLASVGIEPIKLQVVQEELDALKVDLLTRLRDMRKERAFPENYVGIFQSHMTEWLGRLQVATKDFHQEVLEVATRVGDSSRLDECVAALPSRLEESYKGIEAQLQRFCAEEAWKIDDIGILAHLSKTRRNI